MLEPLTELFSVMPVFMWVIGVGYCLAVAGVAAGLIMRGWDDLWAIVIAIGLLICLIGALAGLYATKYPLGGQNIGRLFYFLNAESILSSVFSFPITNAISTGSGDFCLPDRATRNGQYTNPLSPVFSLKLSSTFLNLSFPSS